MSTGTQRADRLVERMFKVAPKTPQVKEEPSAPQSVAARLQGIGESRRKTLAIIRGLKRFQ